MVSYCQLTPLAACNERNMPQCWLIKNTYFQCFLFLHNFLNVSAVIVATYAT